MRLWFAMSRIDFIEFRIAKSWLRINLKNNNKVWKMPINQIIDIVWLASHNQTFSKLKSEFWPILAFKIPICKSQKIRILAQKHQSNHLLVFYINVSNTRLRFAMLWIIFFKFRMPKSRLRIKFRTNRDFILMKIWRIKYMF